MATRDAHRFPADARKDHGEGSLMDLSTSYLGLALRNPLVASASPLSNTVDGVRRLADAGVGAVVLYSLFEEQVRQEAERNARLADAGTEVSPNHCPISRPKRTPILARAVTSACSSARRRPWTSR